MDEGDIREILRSEYGLEPSAELLEMSGGYANRSWRVAVAGGAVLFRLVLQQAREAIEQEIRLLDVLRRAEFPAAFPLARRDGGCITETQAGPVVVYEFIEGVEPRLDARSAREIGRAVGRLSRVEARPEITKPNAISLAACRRLVERFERAPNRLDDVFAAFRRQTERLAPALELRLPEGLVHGDVFPENTLFRDGRLVAIVDFEESCHDRLLFDLAMAANGFCFPGNRLDRDLLDALVEAYEVERPLEDEERELFPEYLRWGAHGMSAWHLEQLVRRPLERQELRVRELQERCVQLEALGDAARPRRRRRARDGEEARR